MSSKIIELLSDDDDDEQDRNPAPTLFPPPEERKPKAKVKKPSTNNTNSSKKLQSGVVLEEDLHSTQPHDFLTKTVPPLLYHDEEFESTPTSIEGVKRSKKVEKCRCSPSQPVQLKYITRGPNKGRPYHSCAKSKGEGACAYFRWAFQSEKLHWYRFGSHTGHNLVGPKGFTAQDLLQGKVGDCWFLSALAVIAERPDLIQRIFECYNPQALERGLVQVNLFLDGFWRTVTLDNFLPCIVDDKNEKELQKAINASMGIKDKSNAATSKPSKTSNYDPFVLSDKNRQVLTELQNRFDDERKKPATTTINPYAKKPPPSQRPPCDIRVPAPLTRTVTTQDLAYSKAKGQQLWVPFLEKAYAKSHGCYQAISGGHIEEAFLDLTGAPTHQFLLHSQPNFDPRSFWYRLMGWRRQRLPMGCATSQSQVGIIGMHAYSILDVVEIKNVGWEFFRDKLQDRTLGNVSGFTELDGTVRLLRIRNPHGRGEWKGDFSDQSDVWEKLLLHSGRTLKRTFRDDGTFWIDYDSFLLGFSNVDVVLAFQGNHARSFETNFPTKQSNLRCTRAFEVCLVDNDSSGCSESKDTVELYVMGIQKTRRGAYHGRSDRKVSYKICDMGILIGEPKNGDFEEGNEYEELEFASVQGEMFGFKRNGHSRLILDREKTRRLIVMPLSFGHPAATDKERSFVLRFVADAPLQVRELPQVPRLDRCLYRYCFESLPDLNTGQRKRKLLLEGPCKGGEPLYRVFQVDCLANYGGVVLVYLCVNKRLQNRKGVDKLVLHLSMEATCRGMMCRTEQGYLTHETVAKGEKFQAAWRKFTTKSFNEQHSRLLMVLVQSGQDSEMGYVKVEEHKDSSAPRQTTITATGELARTPLGQVMNYEKLGIFNGDCDSLDDDERTTIFGQHPTDAASATFQSDFAGVDLELEEALARSRGDYDIELALEMSRSRQTGRFSHGTNCVSMSEDQAIQLAMQRSREEVYPAFSSARATSDPMERSGMASVDDYNLKEAIKRSLETRNAKESSGNDEVVDLVVADDEANLKPQKRMKILEDETEVIDIDDDSVAE